VYWLAVLEVCWLHEDASAVLARVRAVAVSVLDAHHHRVCDLARSRWHAVVAHIADDHRTVTEGQLRAVVLADPHALDKAECAGKPINRFAHFRVDQDRDDRGLRNGAVGFQAALSPTVSACAHPSSRRS